MLTRHTVMAFHIHLITSYSEVRTNRTVTAVICTPEHQGMICSWSYSDQEVQLQGIGDGEGCEIDIRRSVGKCDWKHVVYVGHQAAGISLVGTASLGSLPYNRHWHSFFKLIGRSIHCENLLHL